MPISYEKTITLHIDIGDINKILSGAKLEVILEHEIKKHYENKNYTHLTLRKLIKIIRFSNPESVIQFANKHWRCTVEVLFKVDEYIKEHDVVFLEMKSSSNKLQGDLQIGMLEDPENLLYVSSMGIPSNGVYPILITELNNPITTDAIHPIIAMGNLLTKTYDPIVLYVEYTSPQYDYPLIEQLYTQLNELVDSKESSVIVEKIYGKPKKANFQLAPQFIKEGDYVILHGFSSKVDVVQNYVVIDDDVLPLSSNSNSIVIYLLKIMILRYKLRKTFNEYKDNPYLKTLMSNK